MEARGRASRRDEGGGMPSSQPVASEVDAEGRRPHGRLGKEAEQH